jgi:hypothetical protein
VDIVYDNLISDNDLVVGLVVDHIVGLVDTVDDHIDLVVHTVHIVVVVVELKVVDYMLIIEVNIVVDYIQQPFEYKDYNILTRTL